MQEAIVTQRDGRFVVPVKIEHKGQINGIVHDTSSTGSTVFIEPISIFEMNNELSKLKVDEEIEIEKIYKQNNYDNKSMQIKVTDPKLIAKTGGIIQGMSGSPIIQNGKFIGAVTHVLVNNSQEGYAVFGDLMIKQMKSVN